MPLEAMPGQRKSSKPSALDPVLGLYGFLIEITSRCNLRCGYCPKAQPGNDEVPGRNEDMRPEVFEATKRLIGKYRPVSLNLAGTGETTFAKNWTDLCRPFLRMPGATKVLNTNLARTYDDAELDFLLGFDLLVVSLDTNSPDTLRILRSKSDLKTIVYNILSLRARSKATGKKRPSIRVNCTVTTRNRSELLGLAHLCAELKIDHLEFSDVVELPHAVHQLGIMSTRNLPRKKRFAVLDELMQARKVCIKNRVGFGLQAELEQGLRDSVSAEAQPEGKCTRICTQPWIRLHLAADGQYFPCCVTEQPSLGRIDIDEDPANSPAMRAYREKLLKGEMPSACRDCTNAPLGEVQELVDWIAAARRNAFSRKLVSLRWRIRRAISRVMSNVRPGNVGAGKGERSQGGHL